jgi:hypothetical protein
VPNHYGTTALPRCSGARVDRGAQAASAHEGFQQTGKNGKDRFDAMIGNAIARTY